jgi:hypothetical protein
MDWYYAKLKESDKKDSTSRFGRADYPILDPKIILFRPFGEIFKSRDRIDGFSGNRTRDPETRNTIPGTRSRNLAKAIFYTKTQT